MGKVWWVFHFTKLTVGNVVKKWQSRRHCCVRKIFFEIVRISYSLALKVKHDIENRDRQSLKAFVWWSQKYFVTNVIKWMKKELNRWREPWGFWVDRWTMCHFFMAARMPYQRLTGLNNRNLFSLCSGGWKFISKSTRVGFFLFLNTQIYIIFIFYKCSLQGMWIWNEFACEVQH